MIYLFDKDERLIKLVKKDAIKSALQKFTLTTDRYVSDRLTVEMLDLTAQELEQVEYMAIQSIDDAHKFHFFYLAQKFSEKITTLTNDHRIHLLDLLLTNCSLVLTGKLDLLVKQVNVQQTFTIFQPLRP